MSKLRIISPSPHISSPVSTGMIMWMVSFALLPLMVTSVWVFGLRSLAVIAVSVVSCVTIEFLLTKFVMKQTVLVSDGSAVVTGILLAANLPATMPLYQVVIGAAAAIGIGKLVFGGIGNNPFNPALVGRAFLLISYPVDMTTYVKPGFQVWADAADSITAATPLGVLAEGGAQAADQLPGFMDLFWGNVGGTLGGIGVCAVLLGGLLLIVFHVVDWRIPLTYLGSLAAVTGLAWLINPEAYVNPLFHMMAGGAMLGAFFMVTDYTTTPMTRKGRVIFAASAGVITAVIRLFGALPDGVAYSILFMNALVPLIDRAVVPKPFGRPWVPEGQNQLAGQEKTNG